MACKFQNIKVTEGNEFSLLFPLKSRTYVDGVATDEDIDIVSLEDVTVKVGDTEYEYVLQEDGIYVVLPSTLSKGTYDIVITATYGGSAINAAYFNALTIVSWSYQSDAEQYIVGSPIVMDAEFVIGGSLTDEELEELKTQYQEAIEAAEEAEAAADEAKEEWEEKAGALDDVASETNATANKEEILEALSGITIDTSDLAKQGSNEDATLTDAQAAAEAAQAAAEANYELLGNMVQATEDEEAEALEDLDEQLDNLG